MRLLPRVKELAAEPRDPQHVGAAGDSDGVPQSALRRADLVLPHDPALRGLLAGLAEGGPRLPPARPARRRHCALGCGVRLLLPCLPKRCSNQLIWEFLQIYVLNLDMRQLDHYYLGLSTTEANLISQRYE